MLNRIGNKSYENDPRAAPLKIIYAHLASRTPPLALLEVTDWHAIPESQRHGVLDFLLKSGPEGWCFKRLPGFWVEVLEVNLRDVGLPISENCLQLLLARHDVAPQQKLKDAIHLARYLGAQLPRSSV